MTLHCVYHPTVRSAPRTWIGLLALLGVAALSPMVATAAAAPPSDWTRFGFDAARSDASTAATGITAASLEHLHRQQVALPGTADSSPVFVQGPSLDGGSRGSSS